MTEMFSRWKTIRDIFNPKYFQVLEQGQDVYDPDSPTGTVSYLALREDLQQAFNIWRMSQHSK